MPGNDPLAARWWGQGTVRPSAVARVRQDRALGLSGSRDDALRSPGDLGIWLGSGSKPLGADICLQPKS